MQAAPYYIVVFLIVTTALILLLTGFIITILYLYKKRQLDYLRSLENLKLDHEKNLLQSQVEVQEQTFKHISQEIHDNISLSLTLAKLNLLTLSHGNNSKNNHQISISIDLLSKSLNDLNDISKSMNADIIKQQGLINALKNETERIQKPGLFVITTTIRGNTFFMDAQKELIIFRIIQEAFNNIIKHSQAKEVNLILDYGKEYINIHVCDNGIGFDIENASKNNGAGLTNMKTRAKVFNGQVAISSTLNKGTNVVITIPIEND